MSRLEELIQQLCPDGVEYRLLGKMATIVRGASPRPINNFITTSEDGVNWIKIGDVKPGSKYITNTAEKITPEGAKKSRFVKEGDFILSNSMSFGRPYIMKTEGCIHDGWLAISNFGHYFITDFLYHLLNSSQYQHVMKQKASFGGAVQNLNADIVRDLLMPVVPLEVQREIVCILDQFTERTEKLTAELTAELTARKKQYEYYRDELLSLSSSNFELYRLGDVCEMKAGKFIAATEISDSKDERTPIPCYGGNGVRGYVSVANQHDDCPLIGRQGALCGNVNYATGNYYATEHAVVVKSKGKYTQRYLFYLLTAMNLNQFKSQGAQPGLSVKRLEELMVPVPPIEHQHRIVSILDRFDALCNDLTSGLPAEIEARRKQYEYYRDKLLTFKELEA